MNKKALIWYTILAVLNFFLMFLNSSTWQIFHIFAVMAAIWLIYQEMNGD